MARSETAIVMGALQGIGAGLVDGFLESGYSVVATSLRASESLRSTPDLSGCVISISAALADNLIASANGSLSMITKGGLNAVTRHLPIEHAKQGTRFNAVAPGVVDTPLHQGSPKERLRVAADGEHRRDQQRRRRRLYLSDARQVRGEVLHVDGGDRIGCW